jgi:hypothetical protein
LVRMSGFCPVPSPGEFRMSVALDLDELRGELDRLHQGRGLNRPDLLAHVGPQLREVLRIADNDPDEARRVLVAELGEAARSLSAEYRYVFVMAAAITSTAPTLAERMTIVSGKLDRDARTVRRRLRQADAQAAEYFLHRARSFGRDPSPIQEGWHAVGFESTLWLDRPRPQFHGVRDMIVTAERLTSIEEKISIPRPARSDEDEELEVEAAEGCSLARLERLSTSSWRIVLELDRELHAGQRHRLGLRVTVPSRSFIRPYSVLVPFRQCRTFSTAVHFGQPSAARRAWRLAGVPPVVLEDGTPTDDLYDLARNPTAVASFSSVFTGLAYGIQWEWAA